MKGCIHLDEIRDVTPSADGCEDCLKIGSTWMHLRLCMICGHVGCCDNSPNRHASKHFAATGHPIIRSFEPGEEWGYCFVDDMMFETLPRAETRVLTNVPSRDGARSLTLAFLPGPPGSSITSNGPAANAKT